MVSQIKVEGIAPQVLTNDFCAVGVLKRSFRVHIHKPSYDHLTINITKRVLYMRKPYLRHYVLLHPGDKNDLSKFAGHLVNASRESKR